ncbi:hypothetical protein Rhe02_58080 [Rhizocola hellebori]|uniref:Pyrrolo-quinoline quinone repeat domain-containing protein n=1 Tax=Rhizocola hellebori TaxID=1392758 RepID=A0A8J3QBX3_9ACTN|nr:PQQ-binding-like beta-propeller repeat protein [Rhizocola hellebori]GIH07741.1 hypothetical protein Rhe02_58080 [Rhizocola hellebori]
MEQPQIRRRFATPGVEPALPTVADGVAYLGDADGHLCAIDTADGRMLWQTRHQLRHQDGSAALSSVAALPAVSGDLVLAEAGEQIFAHDRGTGQVRWSVPEISSHHGVVVGDAVLMLHGLESAAAYDLSTGGRRWTSLETTAQLEHHYGFGLLATFPLVAGGRMFLTEGFEGNHTHGGLHAFDVESGAVLWGFHDTFVECEHPDCDGNQQMVAPNHPVFARGLVWVIRDRWCDGDGTAALELIGFDPKTGKEQVIVAEPDEGGIGTVFSAAPVFGADLIYCTRGNALHALDPGSGQLRWSRELPALVVATPLLAEQTLHLATEGGQVHAIDAATGETRWNLTLDEPTSWSAESPGEYEEVTAPLTLADGVLYVATDSAILALS